MGKSISIHPEGFLNPTMAACCLCGTTKPELYFLGAHYDGFAPFSLVVNFIPCQACIEKYGFDKKKVTMIVEAVNNKGKPEPTGRLCVADRSDMKRLFEIDKTNVYLEPEDYELIIKEFDEEKNDKENI